MIDLEHSIWLSNFDSMTISWNTIIFKFRWIFGTDERIILSRQTIHSSSYGSPCMHCSVFLLLPRINGPPQKHYMELKVCPTTIHRWSVAKILRNLKITVFQEMVIESKWPRHHSLLRKMFHLMMWKYTTLLARNALKIHRSAFSGTPGIGLLVVSCTFLLRIIVSVSSFLDLDTTIITTIITFMIINIIILQHHHHHHHSS